MKMKISNKPHNRSHAKRIALSAKSFDAMLYVYVLWSMQGPSSSEKATKVLYHNGAEDEQCQFSLCYLLPQIHIHPHPLTR